MINGDGDGPGDCQGSHPRQQASNQQPAADHLRERCDVGEKDREGQMQRANECISKILDIGELFVTVVNQQRAGEHPKQEQTEIASDGAGQNGANHHRTHRLHTT